MTKSRDVEKDKNLPIWTQCQRIKSHEILRLYMQHIKVHSKWKIEMGKLTHLGSSSVNISFHSLISDISLFQFYCCHALVFCLSR